VGPWSRSTGKDVEAFLSRLSIIIMKGLEGVELSPDVSVDPKETFKFMLNCRCRLEERAGGLESYV